MRGNNNRVIGDIIRKLMKNPKLAGKLDELDALQAWDEIIGKQICKYACKTAMIFPALNIQNQLASMLKVT